MGFHEGMPVGLVGPEPEEARAVAVLLHGRGRDVDDVLSLARRLGDPEVAYVAPAARGGSWYPESFLAARMENEPWLGSALGVVHELVSALGDPRRIVLGGFSQGACLAAEYAVRNPARYGGLLLYTGGVIGPPGSVWPRVGSLEGTPAYFGTADPDDWVPVERVRETATLFGELGADVTLEVFPGRDHVVGDPEIEAGRELLSRITLH
jgi:phospholipase/carboxylesterase